MRARMLSFPESNKVKNTVDRVPLRLVLVRVRMKVEVTRQRNEYLANLFFAPSPTYMVLQCLTEAMTNSVVCHRHQPTQRLLQQRRGGNTGQSKVTGGRFLDVFSSQTWPACLGARVRPPSQSGDSASPQNSLTSQKSLAQPLTYPLGAYYHTFCFFTVKFPSIHGHDCYAWIFLVPAGTLVE